MTSLMHGHNHENYETDATLCGSGKPPSTPPNETGVWPRSLRFVLTLVSLSSQRSSTVATTTRPQDSAPMIELLRSHPALNTQRNHSKKHDPSRNDTPATNTDPACLARPGVFPSGTNPSAQLPGGFFYRLQPARNQRMRDTTLHVCVSQAEVFSPRPRPASYLLTCHGR